MQVYRCVVEDNNDPLKIGRVRVRVFGMHTPNNENTGVAFDNIKSSELPWAEVMGGTEFGLNGGIGLSSVLRQGTWCYCFEDHSNPNKFIIIGTVKGTIKARKKYSAGEGFNDKDDINPFDARTEEPDINRLASNRKLQASNRDIPIGKYNSTDTIHKQINDNLDVQTGIIDGVSGADVSQTEPRSLNDLTQYPNSAVLETQSGHIIEVDDTSGNERLRLVHSTGSYIEMRPDGSIVQKSVNDTVPNHYISMSDVNEHIAKGVKRYIENNIEEIVNQSVKRQIKQNLTEHINGNVSLNVGGNLNWNVGGTVTINSGGNYKVTAPRVDLN